MNMTAKILVDFGIVTSNEELLWQLISYNTAHTHACELN
jgi:hypothetical protein